MATAARRLAFRVITQIDQGGSTLAERLASKDAEALPPRDRAFLHELVLGTLRRRGSLDHALRPLADRGLERLDAGVLAALRLGAYQILHLRVPDRAAVAESVDLARSASPRAAGFVNAVLRRLAREGPPASPELTRDPLEWLTTEGSLPRWIAKRWLARLGTDGAAARARALLAPPPIVYRVNPRLADTAARIDAAGLEARPLTVPGAWQAADGQAAVLAQQGVLYLQDEGSQLVAHLAARPRIVLDACAAPGGKSTLMADLLAGTGRVIAAEASRRRVGTLASLVAAWGAPNVRVVAADASRPPFPPASFDAVLLDAPCSGLGTLGRHPDIRWRSREGDLVRHAQRQRALLEGVMPAVKPGGRLVYSTCSSEPEENEDIVTSFLQAHPEFETQPAPAWAAGFADGAFVRTRPEREGGDAFFAAILERTS